MIIEYRKPEKIKKTINELRKLGFKFTRHAVCVSLHPSKESK
jgi:hypothetical protein